MKDQDTDIPALMATIGANAKAAAAEMAFASPEAKAKALTVAADAIWVGRENILSANALDMELGRSKVLSAAMMDRRELDADRIQSIVDGLRSIAVQEDPVGAVIDGWDMPSGLHIDRVRTPLGVIGVI